MPFKDPEKRKAYARNWMRKRRAETPKKDMSLSHRIYKIDQYVFDRIDSEEKAYFLGFLAADGSNKTDVNTVELSISEKDREIVDLFKKFLKTDKKIKIILPRKTEHSRQTKLTIYNKYLSERLEQLGICKNKSKYLKRIKIKEKLLRHFIRGYFDGDGHIGIKKTDKRFNFNISSTEYFCKWLYNIFRDKFSITATLKFRYPNKHTGCMLYVGGENQILKILDWLYLEAKIKLTRKYEVYLKCKKIRN